MMGDPDTYGFPPEPEDLFGSLLLAGILMAVALSMALAPLAA